MVAYPTHRRVSPVGVTLGTVWMLSLLLCVPWANAQAAGSVQGTAELTTVVMQVARQTIPAVVHIEVTGARRSSIPLRPLRTIHQTRLLSGDRRRSYTVAGYQVAGSRSATSADADRDSGYEQRTTAYNKETQTPQVIRR